MTSTHRHPLRLRQMLRLLVGFAVALALGLTALLLAQSYQAALDDARTRAADAARLLEEHIVRTLRATDFIVGRVAQLGRSRSLDQLSHDEHAWRELLALDQGLPEPGTLWIADPDGIIRLGTIQFPAARSNISDRLYFIAHKQARRDLVIGPLVQTKSRDKQAFHVSRRIEDVEGTFMGVAAAGFDSDTFTNFHRTLPLGEQASITIIDLDGRVVLRQPDPARWVGASVAGGPLMKALSKGEPVGLVTAESPLDGVPRMVAYRLVSEFGLVVAAAVAVDDALASWRRNAMVVAAVAVALMALTWALVRFTFASLSREEALIQGLEEEVRSRTEEARAQAEEARRANESKSRFLASASHDLRQPLQAAGMFVEVLAARLDDSPHLVVVDKLRQSVDATQSLLSTLLDLSTLEAGKIQPQVTTFPLMPMLASLYDQMEPEASAKGLALRVVPTGIRVTSDPVLLERLLRNLMVNAIRYTQTGGVLLGCRRRGDHVEVCVVDSGVGIPDDKRDVVFEDFTRLGDKGSGAQRGLGLGLGVVRRTAHLLGHGLKLRSQSGKGSCFSVLIKTA
ncbi:sensor histidine kinase [Magnetospirillum aberrantis SpK]|uniref:histidine kinase n=2 Tax=Magnetospirillum TaxID=13134 RepID=A0A7C9UTC4_9PROT|nr:sensor histidine kinase [Magnetospirillum aberrantis SpK]